MNIRNNYCIHTHSFVNQSEHDSHPRWWCKRVSHSCRNYNNRNFKQGQYMAQAPYVVLFLAKNALQIQGEWWLEDRSRAAGSWLPYQIARYYGALTNQIVQQKKVKVGKGRQINKHHSYVGCIYTIRSTCIYNQKHFLGNFFYLVWWFLENITLIPRVTQKGFQETCN